jgi:hypothetical protein
MPDPTDIEIHLKTTGETSGADEVKKSIFKVRDEAKKAADQADVDLVRSKQATAANEQEAASLQAVVDKQGQLLALELAKALQGISGKLKGISPELDLIVTGTENFLATFAATGDPIKASLALIATSISEVVTAYMDAEKQTKEIAKQEVEHLKKISELRQNYANQVRTENLTVFFSAELRELDKQEQAMRRITQLRASERELAAAKQASAGAAAVAGGASPEGVAAQALATGLQNSLAQLQDTLDAATAKTEKLESDAILLDQKSKALIENSDEQKASLTAAEAAQQKAEDSRADLTSFTATTLNQMQTLVETGKSTGVEISTAGLEAIREAAVTQQTALKAEVDKLGEKSSSQARAALETLTKVLADGVIKPDEIAKVTDALNRVRSSRELADKSVQEGFETLTKATEAFSQTITPIVANIGNLTRNQEVATQTSNGQANQIQNIFHAINQVNSRVDANQRAY